jgi:alpha-beta hydrolase superfamily lysophospholipase
MKRRAFLVSSLLGAAASASACAPQTPRPSTAPGPARPRLLSDAFVSFDGERLPLTVWSPPLGQRPRAVIVGLHGMNDYAQAFGLAAPFWAQAGVATYAYDQRGFGRTASRGLWAGEAAMQEDLRTLCTLLRARHPGVPLAVVGESMGGAVAVCAFASDRVPDADRLILCSPAVWGWGAQPAPYAAALWLVAHVAPGSLLEAPSWVTRKIRATDNRDELIRMGRDRHMIFKTRVDAVYGLTDLMQHARERIGGVRGPVLYLYGAHDDLIPKPAAFFAAARLPPGGRSAYYAAGYHLLTRDLQAQTVWTDILAFIADPKAPLPSGAPPIPRDRSGPLRTAAG